MTTLYYDKLAYRQTNLTTNIFLEIPKVEYKESLTVFFIGSRSCHSEKQKCKTAFLTYLLLFTYWLFSIFVKLLLLIPSYAVIWHYGQFLIQLKQVSKSIFVRIRPYLFSKIINNILNKKLHKFNRNDNIAPFNYTVKNA